MRGWFTRIFVAVLALIVLGVAAVVVSHLLHKTPPPVETPPAVRTDVIGASVEGRAITAYTYGTGATRLLFVGGMHGGYEWNSVLLAYQFMDYLAAHPEMIPSNESITVIPSINPDGVFKVVGKEGRFAPSDATTSTTVLAEGRFNAHGVDLNRNFDCHWAPQSTWQNKTVSAGTAAFSEPEAQALRTFVAANHPVVAVFWHSQANAVYASECAEGVLPGTLDAMTAYATAAHYPAVKTFDAYPITGDAEGWLASQHIPAITVELSSHESVEWDRNLLGVQALITHWNTAK